MLVQNLKKSISHISVLSSKGNSIYGDPATLIKIQNLEEKNWITTESYCPKQYFSNFWTILKLNINFFEYLDYYYFN